MASTHDDRPADDDEDVFARAIVENSRPWAGYWSWKDKPTAECGAADAILRGAGLIVEGLRSRPAGEDPPDCEAVIGGCRCGIEVTELVHEKALRRSLKGDHCHFLWDRASFLAKVQALIIRKDRPECLRGGSYERYVLVIHTDEFYLGRDEVRAFLEDAVFCADLITDALIGLSYHPAAEHGRQGCCPVFRLPIVRC